jgi:hypothetical protein
MIQTERMLEQGTKDMSKKKSPLPPAVVRTSPWRRPLLISTLVIGLVGALAAAAAFALCILRSQSSSSNPDPSNPGFDPSKERLNPGPGINITANNVVEFTSIDAGKLLGMNADGTIGVGDPYTTRSLLLGSAGTELSMPDTEENLHLMMAANEPAFQARPDRVRSYSVALKAEDAINPTGSWTSLHNSDNYMKVVPEQFSVGVKILSLTLLLHTPISEDPHGSVTLDITRALPENWHIDTSTAPAVVGRGTGFVFGDFYSAFQLVVVEISLVVGEPTKIHLVARKPDPNTGTRTTWVKWRADIAIPIILK